MRRSIHTSDNRLYCSRFYLYAILLASLASGSTLAAADPIAYQCADLPIRVISKSSKDLERVCAGAAKADAFFESHGIKIKNPIPIRLHESIINNHPAHIGLYDSKHNQIDLLSYQQTLQRCHEQPPFGVPMCEPIYISFIVHEISHAIADQNFQYRPVPLIAQEYLAYVAQFATMDSPSQADILQHYDLEPYDSLESMSIIYYGLDPNAFGIKTFLHYQSLSNPGQFIRDLLSGAIKPKTKSLY